MTGYEQRDGKSLISYLTKHNRCNHRGYQNLAKNGDSWIDFKDQVQRFIVDDSSKPVLITVGFVGNDICKNTLEEMTTVEQLRGYLEDGFRVLNEKIGHKDSTVLVYGLVDGGLIWPTLYDKTHPLGDSYESFYDFLTSIDINPCKTWINPDEQTRRAASKRAYDLSQEIKRFIKEKREAGEFNFEVVYEDFPQQQIIDLAHSRNITTQMLIEPVDGFHPSVVYAHPLLAEVTWDLILRRYPHVVGDKNCANDVIQKIFGDQGGY